MKLATRSFVVVLAAALVTACDAGFLGPKDPTASPALGARASASAGLSTSPVSQSKISISWPDGAANESGWEIHRSTTGATGAFTLRASLPANTASYTDSTLASRTEYCYRVRSYRNAGAKKSYAAFSNVGCSTTYAAPPAPSGVNAVPRGRTIIDVSWADNSNTAIDGEWAFRIERADAGAPWHVVANTAQNQTFYSDGSGIMPEVELCYRVIAINPYGESPSNSDCTAAPLQPADVSATSSNSASIDVTWVDASSVEDGYEVQRSGPDGLVIVTLLANSSSFHDTGITSDVVYQYQVRAKRDGGFSWASGWVSAAAASRPPDALVLRYAIPAGSSIASVSWEMESPLTSEVRVERSTDGQMTWSAVATVSADQSNQAIQDAGLTSEVEVCYRVFARNAAGDSPPSNVDCTKPPAAPSNLAITTTEGGARLVTWTDNSNIEEEYVVWTYFCWPEGNCSYETETRYPANTTSIYLGSDGYGRDEHLSGLCAMYEGGLSDCVYAWDAVVTSAASVIGSARSQQPLQLSRPERSIAKRSAVRKP